MSSSIVLLKKDKIKNIWCVSDCTKLTHKKDDRLPYGYEHLLKQDEICNSTIILSNFNIIVELHDGKFLHNICVGHVDNDNSKKVSPFKPIFSFGKYSEFEAEYIIDYYRDNNCEETDYLLKFKIDVLDIEKRIEKIHIVNKDPRTGIINQEETLCLCYVYYDKKELSKVKMLYGE